MLYAVIALAVLVALLAGGILFAFALFRYIGNMVLSGRPVLVTLPGSRPGETRSYAVSRRGWRRLNTPEGFKYLAREITIR